MMSSSKFSDEFKRDAVAQITLRGYPVREVSERRGDSPYSFYAWKKKFAKVDLHRFRSGVLLILSGDLFEGHG